jgi:hypothetical protein
MIRAPSLTAIYAAELKVALARRNTSDGVGRARLAFRTALARPSTLALVAVASGVLGFWLASRPEPRSKSTTRSAGTAARNSTAGLVLAFLVRFGMQRLPQILAQVWAARRKRATTEAPTIAAPVTAPVRPDLSKWPATGSASGVRH